MQLNYIPSSATTDDEPLEGTGGFSGLGRFKFIGRKIQPQAQRMWSGRPFQPDQFVIVALI